MPASPAMIADAACGPKGGCYTGNPSARMWARKASAPWKCQPCMPSASAAATLRGESSMYSVRAGSIA